MANWEQKPKSASRLRQCAVLVRFAPDSEILYIPVPARCNVPPDQARAIWWSPAEFNERRNDYKAIIAHMEQDDDIQWEESRGLEQRTQDGAWKYYTMKQTAFEAVWAEQDRRRAAAAAAAAAAITAGGSGSARCHHPDDAGGAALGIAAAYARAAARAAQEALQRAVLDAQQVGTVVVVDAKPTRHCARTTPIQWTGPHRGPMSAAAAPPPPLGDSQRSLVSVSSKVLPARPRLVRETAGSQRSLVPDARPKSGTDICLDGASLHSKPSTRPRLVREPLVSSKRELLLETSPLVAKDICLNGSSLHSVSSTRPRLVREPLVSSKRELLLETSSAAAKDVCLNGASLHSKSSTRPRLCREPLVSSKRELLDSKAQSLSVDKSTTTNPPVADIHLDGSACPSLYSSSAAASRPRLRREQIVSSKRDVHDQPDCNPDASVVQNMSNRSLLSLSSQALSTRPKLRREMTASRRNLLDTDGKSQQSDRALPSVIFTMDEAAETTSHARDQTLPTYNVAFETSESSLNSVSSQVSSTSSRPLLRREALASSKSLLSCKSNSKKPAREIVLPPLSCGTKQKSKRLLDESGHSLASPVSTSASSSASSSARPALRRQPSMVLNTRNAQTVCGYSGRSMRSNNSKGSKGKDKTPSNRALKTKTGIRFKDQVKFLPPLPVEIPLSEVWLSEHELSEIKTRLDDVIAWMEQGIPVISESSRGLENCTATASEELTQRRKTACHLVLQRQSQLRERGTDGDGGDRTVVMDDLATLYRAATKEARTIAFVHAKLDAKEAEQYHATYPCMI
jgi:hypothetical protein